jgi:hypothetical protein
MEKVVTKNVPKEKEKNIPHVVQHLVHVKKEEKVKAGERKQQKEKRNETYNNSTKENHQRTT